MEAQPGQPLTPREKEILKLLSRGENQKTAGYLLGLRPQTVKNYCLSTHIKLDVRTTTEAIIKFFGPHDWYQDIVDFHKVVMQDGMPKRHYPHIPDIQHVSLRHHLIEEEMNETLEAISSNNLIKIADGIVDSIVVLLGTAVTYGIDIHPIWNEVHRTNMAKTDGKLREDGKRLKPPDWQEPKIKELLVEQGMEV